MISEQMSLIFTASILSIKSFKTAVRRCRIFQEFEKSEEEWSSLRRVNFNSLNPLNQSF